MTEPKWTRRLTWSGPELTIGELRKFVRETPHLHDAHPVGVTAYSNPREGTEITLTVDGILPHESASPADIIVVPPDAVYAQPYFDERTGDFNYRFFNSNMDPIDPEPPRSLIT